MKILYTPSGRAGEYSDKGLACNLYRGCRHGCRYCYAPDVMHMRRSEFHAFSVPVKDALNKLASDCRIVHPEPIFLSFTTDICQPDRGDSARFTLEAIGIIKESGNRVRILTKGRVQDGLLDLLGPEDEFGVTLTLDDDRSSAVWEPFAALPDTRIANLEDAHSRGIRTWASCEPVLCPDSTLWCITAAAPYLDLVKIGKTNHLNRINWPSAEWRKRVELIDWRKFALDAMRLCDSWGLKYYLKADLRAYLPSEFSDIAATPLLPEVS